MSRASDAGIRNADGDESSTAVAKQRMSARGRWLLASYALSGAAALIYEVGWMRELGSIFGSTAYAQGTMLAAFMTGLGAGSMLGGRLSRTTKSPLRDAARAELAVAGFSAITLLGLRLAPGAFFDSLGSMAGSAVVFLAGQFMLAFTLMALPTVAMGVTFPLIMRATRSKSRVGRWSGWLYSWNTAGGIAGSLAAGFVLIPLLGVQVTLAIAVLISAIAAAVMTRLAVQSESAAPFWRSPEWFAAPAALAVVLLIPPAAPLPLGVSQLGRYESYSAYREELQQHSVIFEKESIYSRVVVTQAPDGARSLVNGALNEGSDRINDAVTTRGLAVLPFASAAETSSAMVIGLGTGSTSAALLKLGCDTVTTVEINPAVVPASTYFVGDVLTKDPRSTLVVDDARGYLLTDSGQHDVITAEPSWPLSAATAPLFTREMMETAKSRLTPGGVYCQWLPLYLVDDDALAMMYKTMRSVFPRVDVWAIEGLSGYLTDIALVGYSQPGGPSTDEILKRADSLWSDSLNMPLGKYEPYAEAASLATAAEDPSVPLNTDDHSRIEYKVVWSLLDYVSQEGQQ